MGLREKQPLRGNFCVSNGPWGSSHPKPFVCPSAANCFSFSGGGFTYVKENPITLQPVETVNNAQIVGMFQLNVTK